MINDVSSLRAIGSLCPHLVTVHFVRDENENLLPDEKLESSLKEWPKVCSINIIVRHFSHKHISIYLIYLIFLGGKNIFVDEL